MKSKALLLTTAILAGTSAIGVSSFAQLVNNNNLNETNYYDSVNNSEYISPEQRIHFNTFDSMEVGSDYIALSIMSKSTAAGINTNIKPQLTSNVLYPNIYINKLTEDGVELSEKELVYKLEDKFTKPSRITTINPKYNDAYVTSKYMMPTFDIMITNDDVKGLSVDDPDTKDDVTTNKDDVLAVLPYEAEETFYWGDEELNDKTVLTLGANPLLDESLFNNQLESPPEEGLVPGETYEMTIQLVGNAGHIPPQTTTFKLEDTKIIETSQSHDILSQDENYDISDVANKIALGIDYSSFEEIDPIIETIKGDIKITSADEELNKLVNDITIKEEDYQFTNSSKPYYDLDESESEPYRNFSKSDGYDTVSDSEYSFIFDEEDDYVYDVETADRFRDVSRLHTNKWSILEFKNPFGIYNQVDNNNIVDEDFLDNRKLKFKINNEEYTLEIHPLKLLTIKDDSITNPFSLPHDWEDTVDRKIYFKYWINLVVPNNDVIIAEYEEMYKDILLDLLNISITAVDTNGEPIDDIEVYGSTETDHLVRTENYKDKNYYSLLYKTEKLPQGINLEINIDQYSDDIFNNLDKDVNQRLTFNEVVTLHMLDNFIYNEDGSAAVDFSTPTLSTDGESYSLDVKLHRKEGDLYTDVNPELNEGYNDGTSIIIADLYEGDITNSYKTSYGSFVKDVVADVTFNSRKYGDSKIVDGNIEREVIDEYTISNIPLGYEIIFSTWLTTVENTFVSHDQHLNLVMNPIAEDDIGYEFEFKSINPYKYKPIQYFKDNSVIGEVNMTPGSNSATLEFDVNYDYANYNTLPEYGFINKTHSTYDKITDGDIDVVFTPVDGGEEIYADVNVFLDEPTLSDDESYESIDNQHITATAYGLNPNTTYNYEIIFNNNTFDDENKNSKSGEVKTLENEVELLYKDFKYSFKLFDPTTLNMTVGIESKNSYPINAKSARLDGDSLNEFTSIKLIDSKTKLNEYTYEISGLQAGKEYDDLELTIENHTQAIDPFTTKAPLKPSEPTILGFDYDTQSLKDKSVNIRYRYKLPIDDDEEYNLGHEEITVDSLELFDAETNKVISTIIPTDKTVGDYGQFELKDLEPETDYSYYLKLNYHSDTIKASETSDTISLTTKPLLPSLTNNNGWAIWLIILISVTLVGSILLTLPLLILKSKKEPVYAIEYDNSLLIDENSSEDELDGEAIVPYSEQELLKMKVPELIKILVDSNIELNDAEKHKKVDYVNMILENELGKLLNDDSYEEFDIDMKHTVFNRKELHKFTKDRLIVLALQNHSEEQVMGLTKGRLIDLILGEH